MSQVDLNLELAMLLIMCWKHGLTKNGHIGSHSQYVITKSISIFQQCFTIARSLLETVFLPKMLPPTAARPPILTPAKNPTGPPRQVPRTAPAIGYTLAVENTALCSWQVFSTFSTWYERESRPGASWENYRLKDNQNSSPQLTISLEENCCIRRKMSQISSSRSFHAFAVWSMISGFGEDGASSLISSSLISLFLSSSPTREIISSLGSS